MYTSTIGASLPVIDTLGNILRTGDRVLRIETGLSGSMGYVTNEVMNGASLSSAMRDAFSRGYCERDPREDLAGKDVVAKIIVLARALGVRLQARAIKESLFLNGGWICCDYNLTFLCPKKISGRAACPSRDS